MNSSYIIGIAGGTGSGKTTLSQSIRDHFHPKNITHITHDSYYKDQSHLKMEDRMKTNYDHPNSLETELLVQHVKELQNGNSVIQPTYNFTQHTRAKKTVTLKPKPIILIEGILIFSDESLRDLFDMKIFVDTDADLRLARRLVRDVAHRGRSFEEGIEQYLEFVKPMHEQFVEPSKKFADIIVPEGGFNTVAIHMIRSQIEDVLKKVKEK